MKKIILLGMLIALYPALSFGQSIYSLKDIQVGDNEIVLDQSGKAFTGILSYTQKDKEDKMETFSRQEKDLKSLWDSDQRSTSKENYKIWKKETNKIYKEKRKWDIFEYLQKNQKAEISFKNGKRNGTSKIYEDDTVIKEYTHKDGYLDGVQIGYDRYHPGEVAEKTEYKMNRCVNTIHYRDGKPEFGYRAKNNPKQQRVSKVTGLPITESPSKEIIPCLDENSVIEHYDYKGNLSFSDDRSTKTRTYYADNNRVYVQMTPVPEKFKDKADYIYTAYYENNKPMLKLTVKEDKAIAGEFYSTDGKKTVLDEQKATDYLMDIALSISLGAQ